MADPNNYSSNSKKKPQGSTEEPSNLAKAPEKEPVTKIVSGTAIERKRPFGRRIVDTFAGDDAHSVGQFIMFDVIMPAVKATITDVVSQGIERMLYGEVRGVRSTRQGGPVGAARQQTAYNRPVNGGMRPQEAAPRTISQRGRATHDFKEIVFPTRGDAEVVLDRMRDFVDRYDVVSVSDFYASAGISGSWADDKWGWFNLIDAGVRNVRQGYIIELPPTEEITQ